MQALETAQRSSTSLSDDPIDLLLQGADDYSPNPVRALRRLSPARQVMKNEKPWHRTAAYLAARGFQQKEIAASLDVSTAQVSLVSAQPWFREECARIIAEFGLAESARDILEAAAAMASQGMVTLMMSATSESVKLNASKDILDRVLGKADQNIVHKKGHVPIDPADEIREIEAELVELRKEQEV